MYQQFWNGFESLSEVNHPSTPLPPYIDPLLVHPFGRFSFFLRVWVVISTITPFNPFVRSVWGQGALLQNGTGSLLVRRMTWLWRVKGTRPSQQGWAKVVI